MKGRRARREKLYRALAYEVGFKRREAEYKARIAAKSGDRFSNLNELLKVVYRPLVTRELPRSAMLDGGAAWDAQEALGEEMARRGRRREYGR